MDGKNKSNRSKWDIDSDVFDSHVELKFTAIDELLKKYKIGQEYVWVVLLRHSLDPENPLRNLPRPRRIERSLKMVSNKSNKLDLDILKEIEKLYKDVVPDKPVFKSRDVILEKLTQRNEYIESLAYNSETASQIDSLLLATNKIIAQYEEIEAKADEETKVVTKSWSDNVVSPLMKINAKQ